MRYFLPLLFCLLTTTTQPVSGQSTSTDSSFVRLAKDQSISAYERAFSHRPDLYSGSEYIIHDYRIKVHPFYPSDSVQSGYVYYNGFRYDDVRMQYDIVRDELLVKHVEGTFRVRLHSERIDAFSLDGRPFVRIVSDTLKEGGVRTGFYEVLYDGPTKVFAKRIKTVLESVASGKYTANFQEKNRYFIQRAGTYQEVKNKRALLTLFADQDKALRRYMRANQLSFKKKREETITRLAKQYDELVRR